MIVDAARVRQVIHPCSRFARRCVRSRCCARPAAAGNCRHRPADHDGDDGSDQDRRAHIGVPAAPDADGEAGEAHRRSERRQVAEESGRAVAPGDPFRCLYGMRFAFGAEAGRQPNPSCGECQRRNPRTPAMKSSGLSLTPCARRVRSRPAGRRARSRSSSGRRRGRGYRFPSRERPGSGRRSGAGKATDRAVRPGRPVIPRLRTNPRASSVPSTRRQAGSVSEPPRDASATTGSRSTTSRERTSGSRLSI